MAKVIAICTSPNKGMRKKDVGHANLLREYGIEGDAHASGEWHRQVSLLAWESIEKMRAKGLDVGCGDFAENLTTQGIELYTLPIGTRLRLGEQVIGEVSQIGKECHTHCAIYQQAGDCVMPREGIFIRVLSGGELTNGDEIKVDNSIITVGVIVASDKCSAGQREDKSGVAAAETIAQIGGITLDTQIIPDEREQLAAAMRQMADQYRYDLILVSGGTGFSLRDVTPEATLDVIERQVPGLPEAMRASSLAVSPHAMLSRAIAGIRGRSLIINLPGSPKAVRENLQAVMTALPHGIDILRGVASECGSSK